MSSVHNRICLIGVLTTLLAGCQGSYLNGFLVVDKMQAKEQSMPDNQRASVWGECASWRLLTITSDNDVDTAYNKLIRSDIIRQPVSVPQTNNAQINKKINAHWTTPDEKPHLVYRIPPRWVTVQVDDFEQTGAVAFGVSKRNRKNLQGSFIDIEYCEGGQYDIGFHVPDHMKDEFEALLTTKFKMALKY